MRSCLQFFFYLVDKMQEGTVLLNVMVVNCVCEFVHAYFVLGQALTGYRVTEE